VFVSRYRGFLVVLIVLIHTGITHGASGSWYYTEQHDALWLKVMGTFIGAVAQSFALGPWFGSGPLWFLEALYLFMLVYLAGKLVFPRDLGIPMPPASYGSSERPRSAGSSLW
jgi:hypothetical protein